MMPVARAILADASWRRLRAIRSNDIQALDFWDEIAAADASLLEALGAAENEVQAILDGTAKSSNHKISAQLRIAARALRAISDPDAVAAMCSDTLASVEAAHNRALSAVLALIASTPNHRHLRPLARAALRQMERLRADWAKSHRPPTHPRPAGAKSDLPDSRRQSLSRAGRDAPETWTPRQRTLWLTTFSLSAPARRLEPGRAMDEELAIKVFGFRSRADGTWKNGLGRRVGQLDPLSTVPPRDLGLDETFTRLSARSQNKDLVFERELARARACGVDPKDDIERMRIAIRAMERWMDAWVSLKVFGWEARPGPLDLRPPGWRHTLEPPPWSTHFGAARVLRDAIAALPEREVFRREFLLLLEDSTDPWWICKAALGALNPSGGSAWPAPPLGNYFG